MSEREKLEADVGKENAESHFSFSKSDINRLLQSSFEGREKERRNSRRRNSRQEKQGQTIQTSSMSKMI